MDRYPFQIRLTKDELSDLKLAAFARSMTLSALVREALALYLGKRPAPRDQVKVYLRDESGRKKKRA